LSEALGAARHRIKMLEEKLEMIHKTVSGVRVASL